MIKTINSDEFNLVDTDFEFNYQPELTKFLDDLKGEYEQRIIDKIILWKVSRYANLDEETLSSINSIDSVSTTLDEALTKDLLSKLLKVKGIGLPMASTILRFKNPNIYQIIDQRVYRIINGEVLKLKNTNSDSNIQDQIQLYINYLKTLGKVSIKLKIPYSKSDRILYEADKRFNKGTPLNNY